MANGSRVLKNPAVPAHSSQFNVRDLQIHAVEIIEDARRRASQIIADAEQTARSLQQEAATNGERAGLERGLQNARSEIEDRVAEGVATESARRLAEVFPIAERVIEAIESAREEWRLAWEREAVMLAIAVAEKIIHRQLECDPSIAIEMISAALQMTAGLPEIRVSLPPATVSIFEADAREFLERTSRCASVVVIPDASLEPGDCVVESANGTVDARLETVLERIADELSPSENVAGAG